MMPKLHRNKNTHSASTMISVISLLTPGSREELCLEAAPCEDVLREDLPVPDPDDLRVDVRVLLLFLPLLRVAMYLKNLTY